LESGLELGWPDPHERCVELRDEIVSATKNSQLRALGFIGWRGAHAAAAHQYDCRRSLRYLSDECRSRRHFQCEIDASEHQIVHVELTRGVERQPITAGDGR